jgi:glycosyltransferase involved in cell wall biosynthesis
LMVCYYYPPLADVGCKRSVAFSVYFSKYGWNPHVLSVKNPDKTYCLLGKERPPEGIHVTYAYSLVNVYKFFSLAHGLLIRALKPLKVELRRNYFFDIFCVPDIFFGWIPHAVIEGKNIISKRNIDLIYVSCSPWSSAVVGAMLKELTGKKLIIDFRDPYAIEIPTRNKDLYPFGLRKKVDRRIEEYVLKKADIIILNTEETRALYIEQYPHIRHKAFTVHNGFDAKFLPKNTDHIKFDKFTVIYTGEFYFYASNGEVFFKALKKLKDKKEINRDNFQFLFYGDGGKKIKQLSRKYGVEDLVKVSKRIPHDDLLKTLKKSHLQLLRIVKPAISTKLFEGTVLNIPFLATIPTGEVQDIIKKYSPSSYIINDDSHEKLAEAIQDAWEKYKNKKIRDNHISKFLINFSREKLTEKMVRIVDSHLFGTSLKN